ncbi:MAG: LytTR family DNA-binding domain-containing protein [Clostridium sp.]|uniref:LytR/AlgR family response regulator transcription factor n=1 Tax=Clostridium sp. TaxID=1506 RepID=UPI00302B15EE
MLGIVICEDNLIQRERLAKSIENFIDFEEYDMSIELKTGDPRKVLSYLDKNKGSNVYFLDVDLGTDINGIELASEIRKYDPRGFIVFVTTHSEMSVLTFKYKVEAMDYIIKDDTENFNDRIKDCLQSANTRIANVDGISNNKIFTVKVGSRLINVKYDDIMFIETSPTVHKLILHAKNRQVEFYGRIKDLEEQLGDEFFRCHRAFIVNMSNVVEVKKTIRVLIMRNGEECLVSTRCLYRF